MISRPESHNEREEQAKQFWAAQKPIFDVKRKLKVACIGAGASGLFVAYKFQRHFDNIEFQAFEKNTDISGTWHENKYPGCACDIPAHNYTYSFEPKADWSANYAASREINKYFHDFADKYDLHKYVKLNHRVIGAKWLEEQGMWELEIEDAVNQKTFMTTFHILIRASGVVNAWKWPAIPGLADRYKGRAVHSAAWPDDLDLRGKTVGLIGNGSSGIQILPAIAKDCGKLTTFIRSPTWVSPPYDQEYRVFTEQEKAKFAEDPEYLLQFRKKVESMMNGQFTMFNPASESQAAIRGYFTSEMQRKLNNPKLAELLIPKWSVGCRRLTPGPNYLETLSNGDAEVVYGEIKEISEKGPVMEDGSEHPVDVLICATGFDTSFRPRFPMLGKNGVSLADQWKEDPAAYLGMAAHDFPNCFMLLGPGYPVGNGPLLPAVEASVEYIMKVVGKYQKENLHSFNPKQAPVDEFMEWRDRFMQNTVWADDCRSWYKAGSAGTKVVALWPGSTLHFVESVSEVRWEDWDIEYQAGANRWAYLGNGQSSSETRKGDLAHYLRLEDESKLDPCLKTSLWQEDHSGSDGDGTKPVLNAVEELKV